MGCETSMHFFSLPGGPDAVSIKSVGTRYAEHVFLHVVRYAGHVVCLGASGREALTVIFHARMGSVWVPQEARRDLL
jgi:hypothetical protein